MTTISESKISKMWYIESIKNGTDFEIKKVCDNSQNFVEYNAETHKATCKNGDQLELFKTFKEAAIITINKKIVLKKEIWQNLIDKSYELNIEIGNLFDKLNELKALDEQRFN